jgi:hypothetical protein
MENEARRSSVRQRIVYAFMSIFVTLHSLALIVGPAPRESEIAEFLNPALNAYLSTIYLNVGWGFFAPVGMTRELFYTVEDKDGKMHVFGATRGLPWYSAKALWVRDRFLAVGEDPKLYGPAPAAEFCRKHAKLNPVRIILFEKIQEKHFAPADHKAGKNPLDPEFAKQVTLGTFPCPKA